MIVPVDITFFKKEKRKHSGKKKTQKSASVFD